MHTVEAQIGVMGERLIGHMDTSVAHRESVAGQLAGIDAGLKRTETGILRMQELAEARELREAEAAEREAVHRREMERLAVDRSAAHQGRVWDTIRAAGSHPAVVSLLTAIAGAVTLWAYSTFGAPPETSQRAATGVMSAPLPPATGEAL